MPEPKRKMRANEIEAEIMQRIADHPDCGNVSGITVRATDAEAPNPSWEFDVAAYRGWPQQRCTQHIIEVVNDLQREIDLSDK